MKLKFNSFGAFLDQVQKPGHAENGKASRDKPSEWNGGHSWDEVIELAKNGWPEGLARIMKAASLVETPKGARSFEPQPVLALAGDEVDVGLYLTGEPECMTDWEIVETPTYGKVAKIVVNASASSSVSPEQMFRRGAAAVLLIDALETCGIRCEVWVLPQICGCAERNPPDCTSEVLVKKAEDPPELDRLAFMLAHPAVLRRLAFRLMEQAEPGTPVAQSTSDGGYGGPTELNHLRDEEGTIYFGARDLRSSSEEQMAANVQSILDKFLEC